MGLNLDKEEIMQEQDNSSSDNTANYIKDVVAKINMLRKSKDKNLTEAYQMLVKLSSPNLFIDQSNPTFVTLRNLELIKTDGHISEPMSIIMSVILQSTTMQDSNQMHITVKAAKLVSVIEDLKRHNTEAFKLLVDLANNSERKMPDTNPIFLTLYKNGFINEIGVINAFSRFIVLTLIEVHKARIATFKQAQAVSRTPSKPIITTTKPAYHKTVKKNFLVKSRLGKVSDFISQLFTAVLNMRWHKPYLPKEGIQFRDMKKTKEEGERREGERREGERREGERREGEKEFRGFIYI